MMRRLWQRGSAIITRPQGGILSAAVILMVMVAVSRVLGLLRNRVLADYFTVETLSVYFAAFRIPEVAFEVLVFGSLSSAFVPVFVKYFSKGEEKQAWRSAAMAFNFALLFFLFLAGIIWLKAEAFYQVVAPGFGQAEIKAIAHMSRILLVAQLFFLASYFTTGVLESLKRFLLPAIAPLFYNLGVILGAIFLSRYWGIEGAAIGAVVGAFVHFVIQLPLAWHFGFRPVFRLDFRDVGVKEIGRLAWPRVIELSFLQLGKLGELFFASLVAPAAFAYYTFAAALQLLPISLFGTSIAKASLPVLARHTISKDKTDFVQTLRESLGEILFLTLPAAVFLAVLRIPLTRIVFGASKFTWEATLQTSYVVSAFSLGVVPQALIFLLARSFYALRDTVTPVKVSLSVMVLNVLLGWWLILFLRLDIWALALASSVAAIVQVVVLLWLLRRRVAELHFGPLVLSFAKMFLAAGLAGGAVYGLVKIFDRVVVDTRYVSNLIIFILVLTLLGGIIYLVLSWCLKITEVKLFWRLWGRLRLSAWRNFQQNEIVGGEGEHLD